MTGLFQMARDALSAELEKYRNRGFMEAVMAGSALVASADGEINLTEASTLDQALETIEELKVYDPHVAIDIYRDWVDALNEDRDKAEREILGIVAELADDREAAETLIRVCVAVGRSDSEFSPSEAQAVARLCQALNIDIENQDGL